MYVMDLEDALRLLRLISESGSYVTKRNKSMVKAERLKKININRR